MTDATTGTDIAVRQSMTDVESAIEGLNTGAAIFSTVTGDDFDTKLLVMAAVIDSKPIDENINKVIELQNIIIQPVELTDEKTGEVNVAPRVVLLDADGTAYHGTSIGLLSSVRNIMATVGHPASWPKPLSIVVVREKSRNNAGSFFTIKPAPKSAK
jgi:hypothetical protein